MSRVRSHGNATTELYTINILRKLKIKGWRRQIPLPGKPDFCWPRERITFFIDGCFWHGCPKCYKTPKSNVAFWNEKVIANRKRDRSVNRKLKEMGWKVVRIWECELGKKQNKIDRLKKLVGS